jgi:hypothetical protein
VAGQQHGEVLVGTCLSARRGNGVHHGLGLGRIEPRRERRASYEPSWADSEPPLPAYTITVKSLSVSCILCPILNVVDGEVRSGRGARRRADGGCVGAGIHRLRVDVFMIQSGEPLCVSGYSLR